MRETSVNFDHTKNLYIEGDNLDVLKCLRETYLNKVKLIYIDPPYNTGKDFIYADHFQESIDSYVQRSSLADEEGNYLVSNPVTNGRFHTDWLNMIYPRLRVARDLLSDDGVILINIDEHEVINLHKVVEELFGEQNSLGTIIWDKRNPKGDSKGIAAQHEYILVFAKNKTYFLENCKVERKKKHADAILKKAKTFFTMVPQKLGLEEANAQFQKWLRDQSDFSGGEMAYNRIDENGRVYRLVSMAWPNNKKAPDDYFFPLIHPITKKACPVPGKGWRNPPSRMKELLDQNRIAFGPDESTQPQRIYYLDENMMENIPSLLYFGGSDDVLLKKLGVPFDNPKVVEVCREHIAAFTNQDSIVLDFFSGSGTVAHAVMKQNSIDGGHRQFIMVQWPEVINKPEFKTICDIGRKRIQQAGIQLQKEQSTPLDVGFRTFRLDTGNFEPVVHTPDETKQAELFSLADNIKSDRTPEDMLVQVMLSLGATLDSNIARTTIAEKEIFNVSNGFLMACFDQNITDEVVEAIARKQPRYAVLRDACFASDSVADNFEQIFKTYAPNTICKVI